MEFIKEDVRAGRTRYLVISDDGEIERKVDPTVYAIDADGREVVLFYTSDYKPISALSLFFLDSDMKQAAANTREQAKSALRLLLAYCEVRQLYFDAFDKSDARAFLDFIRGISVDGLLRSYHLVTMRAESTVSAYLAHIRNLCRFLDLGDSPFLLRKQSPKYKSIAEYGTKKSEPYVISTDHAEPVEAPHFVSAAEYERLLLAINTNGLPGDVIMVRLMYEHGLRIGECLGLTLEDVKDEKNADRTKRYYLILRDRPCDGLDQHAKTTSKVITKADCETKRYRTRNEGYQEVSISSNLRMALIEYIEEAHGIGNVQENACAECVTGNETNAYVFLNTRGGRLKKGAWDKRLRNHFINAGLFVDRDIRKNNLNHRLRHGFGMFLVESGFDARSIQILMRHSSIKSQAPYTRPTPERIAQIQQLAIAKMEERLSVDIAHNCKEHVNE